MSCAPSPQLGKGGAFGKLAKRPESPITVKAPALSAHGTLSSPHGRLRKRRYHPDRFFEIAFTKREQVLETNVQGVTNIVSSPREGATFQEPL